MTLEKVRLELHKQPKQVITHRTNAGLFVAGLEEKEVAEILREKSAEDLEAKKVGSLIKIAVKGAKPSAEQDKNAEYFNPNEAYGAYTHGKWPKHERGEEPVNKEEFLKQALEIGLPTILATAPDKKPAAFLLHEETRVGQVKEYFEKFKKNLAAAHQNKEVETKVDERDLTKKVKAITLTAWLKSKPRK